MANSPIWMLSPTSSSLVMRGTPPHGVPALSAPAGMVTTRPAALVPASPATPPSAGEVVAASLLPQPTPPQPTAATAATSTHPTFDCPGIAGHARRVGESLPTPSAFATNRGTFHELEAGAAHGS